MSIRALHLVARAVALVTMLAVAVVTLPTATAAVVTCCCGDHDAHRDCGCVDCPAGHAGGARGDGTPSMKACKSQSAEVTLASGALALPPPIAAVRELVIVATPATPVACVARGAVAPPSPPPRG